MEIGGDKMITALERIGQGWGEDKSQPNDEGVLIWRPRRSGAAEGSRPVQDRRHGTHRNFYSDGRYMHLAAGMPGIAATST